MKKLVLAVLLITLSFTLVLQAGQTFKMAVGAQSGQEIRSFFEKVYNEAGFEVEFVALPTLRQISDFNNANVDGILFLSEDILNNEIEDGFGLGFGEKALFAFPLMGYAKIENVEKFNSLKSFEGLRVLYIHGNIYHDGRIKDLGAIPAVSPNIESAVQMVNAGRADVLMTAPRAPDAAIKQLDLEGKISMLARPLSMNNYYHVISLRFEEQKELLSSILVKYQEEFAKLLGQ